MAVERIIGTNDRGVVVVDVRRLQFGDVTISWDGRHQFPIAVNHNKLNGDKPLITITRINYTWGKGDNAIRKFIWADYGFDGASVPALLTVVPGFSKIGWHLFGALIHDFACDYPSEIPRPIGDGIFRALLLAIAETGSGSKRRWRRFQAWSMSAAVNFFTFVQAMKGVPIMAGPEDTPV